MSTRNAVAEGLALLRTKVLGRSILEGSASLGLGVVEGGFTTLRLSSVPSRLFPVVGSVFPPPMLSHIEILQHDPFFVFVYLSFAITTIKGDETPE